MPTKDECIEAAARCFASAYEQLETLPIEEAARIAWTPTGPPIEELEWRIREYRGLPPVDETSVAAGLDVPASPAATEHHRRTA